MAIKFGTDGWRSIIADEFTFGNLKIVTQAIANYLKNNNKTDKGIFIGYDNRFLAEEFAEAIAEVLLGNDIEAIVAKEALPTPVTAFAIQEEGFNGALMLTASHNPAHYQGIKFIPEYAGPALPEITDQIEEEVAKVQKSGDIQAVNINETSQEVKKLDPKSNYLKHLQEVIDFSQFNNQSLNILVNPMYGAGIGYLTEIFADTKVKVEEMNGYRDPLFGGGMPEPTEAELPELMARVKEDEWNLGLALDGDADRFGIITGQGQYLSPNQVLFLLLDYLVEDKELNGGVAKTVATTHMLDRIAKKHGLEVFETPVGFKYIGNMMLNEDIIIGGEESGGLSIKGHIPEKDGLLACVLIVEMIMSRGERLTTILKQVEEKYGKLISERLDIECSPAQKPDVLKRIEGFDAKKVAGQRVVKKIDKDGMKVILEDGSWCLMRPSGTEPLIRIYVETADKKSMKKIQDEVRDILKI
ncbi:MULTISPECIES: phosphoglucomutase/phosphomannomutase family protein [unclassified Candidatus Frackibacter]|uniref:phosphoglucomutase/phosphomannomutase family protein n=1 Tax=unclassified Candidatus Frackibacter TaxID=2648818 RepID=UPI00079C43B6|nr:MULTISPECIES: phosphoglucomutase/phosphomannomutase family protein [unclassified Candidatus Frackibacter]KXS44402.1 MAG: phosphoglucomutase/phosphomannomutase alpha/beta/alpha domain I [Candidatus Frackibacter sp. T328-2]SDC70821.1 phosphoglucomutase, alpha-D-glucose phosphate-specific [Candidatus Frackibacter sp. WG11]SEM84694.1 phosphoglucomutase, alpha-D-glucose phosphate-specific [Candidatus Frackibacter sp. WG12]SFL93939.1 phosphoglucomutase, alpha-D-glucose phosphate-specific [Candidat